MSASVKTTTRHTRFKIMAIDTQEDSVLDLPHERQYHDQSPYPQNNGADFPPQTSPLGDWFEVYEAPGKGLGVFATRDIPGGTIILAEEPLFFLKSGASTLDVDSKVNALTPRQQAAFKSLTSFRRCIGESDNEAILHTNCFRAGEGRGAIFATASRFNHACCPNAEYTWDARTQRILFMARWNLFKGQEILINYGTVYKEDLRDYWGFDCQCGDCSRTPRPLSLHLILGRKLVNYQPYLILIVPILWAFLVFKLSNWATDRFHASISSYKVA